MARGVYRKSNRAAMKAPPHPSFFGREGYERHHRLLLIAVIHSAMRLTRGSSSCITCRAFWWRHPGRRLEFDRGLTSPVVSFEPANASSTAKFDILDRRSKRRSVWATPGGATFWAAALSGHSNLLRTVELCRGTWFRVHCGNHLAGATSGFFAPNRTQHSPAPSDMEFLVPEGG